MGRLHSLFAATNLAQGPVRTFLEDVSQAVDEIVIGDGSVSFVWRPGDPNPTGNVYATWAALYAALSARRGAKLVLVDASLAPALVPAGTYDLPGVTFRGAAQRTLPTQMGLADGAQLRDVARFEVIRVVGLTTGGNQLAFTAAGPVLILDGATIQGNGGGFPLQRTTADPLFLQLLHGGRIGTGVETVVGVGANGNVFVQVDGLSAIGDNAIDSDPGATVIFQYEDGSQLPASLPGMADPPILQPRPSLVARVLYVATNGSDTAGDGSRQRPLATVQEAMNRATDRTTIFVAPGTYNRVTYPSPPPENLAIIGMGNGSTDGVVIRSEDPGELAFNMDLVEADGNLVDSLVLRNLLIVSDLPATEAAVFRTALAAGGTDFLEIGLFCQNVTFRAAAQALQIGLANRVFLQGCTIDGLSTLDRVGEGFIEGCNQTANQPMAITCDQTQPLPVSGINALFIKGCNFSNGLFCTGEPDLQIDAATKVNGALQLNCQNGGGQVLRCRFRGNAEMNVDVFLRDIDANPPVIDLDGCVCEGDLTTNVTAVPLAMPRPVIRARGAALRGVDAAEETIIDVRGSSYETAVGQGAGATQGAVDRDQVTGVIAGITNAPQTQAINPPLPPGTTGYRVTYEVAAATVVATTTKTASSFDYTGSVAGPVAGGFVLTRDAS